MYSDHSVSNHSAYYSFSPGPSTFASSHGNNNLGQSNASSSSAMPSHFYHMNILKILYGTLTMEQQISLSMI